MLHSRTLDKVSRPGMRFQGWRNLPIGSKIAVVVLLVIVAMAVFVPIVAPYDPGATGLATAETKEFDVGATDFEMYLGYQGIGLDKYQGAFGTEATLGYGIAPGFSASVGFGFEANEYMYPGASEI